MTTPTDEGPAIRTDVPISLHPGSLNPLTRTLNQEGTVGARALGIARSAMTAAYAAYANVEDAVQSLPLGDEVRMVNGRPTKLAIGAIDQLVTATEAASGRILASIQKGYEELEKIGAALDERIATALDDPARKPPPGIAVATEIRGYVKGLPDAKRTAFAHAAVEAGDKATVAAILHAPAYLSGFTDKHLATLRQRAAAAFAPVDNAQREAVRDASDKVAAAGSRLVERFGRVRAMASPAATNSRDKIKALAETGA